MSTLEPVDHTFMSPEVVGQPQDLAQTARFFIPARSSLYEQRTRTLKEGDTFAVFEPNGDVLSSPGNPQGIFHRDTRHLSHLEFSLNGARPILLASTLRDDNATLTCDLTNPSLLDQDRRVVLEHDLLHVRRSRFIWHGTCHERVLIRNFDTNMRRVTLHLRYDADFADLFEARGTARERRGEVQPPEIGPDCVTLAYHGLDGKRRCTRLRFEPAPERLDASEATFAADLAPGGAHVLFFEITCGEETRPDPVSHMFLRALRDARRHLNASTARAVAVSTSNETFNATLRRSSSDLYMLVSQTPEGPYPYAGVPWFSTVFGRDGLITALETLWFDPELARGVLLHLAANQAREMNPEADAEPGKILHEVRYGEMAELGEVPFRRYYGSVDSTPLFVMLAGAYLHRTGDVALMARLWPHVLAALDWITQYGDRDGDGFVEYGRHTDSGLINQGWKDSHDSVFHADGTLARGPIALVEVQAYVYGAWKAAADIAGLLGRTDQVDTYNNHAETLRRAFDRAFFDDGLQTYVLALDGQKNPCRVRTSNAGHALWTGIAYPERASAVVETLMGRALFCGWGIRTAAASEVRFNPISYHNGSVWPHDNALIAAGMARYGFTGEAGRIFEGIFTASTYIDLYRLPELLCGFPRERARGPTFYPVACLPQAWAAAAPLSMLQSCLGLTFDPGASCVTFTRPTLPGFLDEVTLCNLRLGDGRIDVALRRSGSHVVVDLLSRQGRLDVVTQL